MNKEKEYFIYLLSCFLNQKKPEGQAINWKAVYDLADIHDVSGIIAQEIKLLPDEYKPENELKSYFNQRLGFTVQSYARNENTKNKIKAFLDDRKTRHIFVKGASIRRFYPVSELRTSSDIDVIIEEGEFDSLINDMRHQGFKITDVNYDTVSFVIDSVNVELHRNSDVYNSYFNNIFSFCENTDGCTYELGIYYHLLYVICHLCKHLLYLGAGIRMLMDIDVLIRSIENFDESKLIYISSQAGLEKTVKILLSLCRLWFKTPVNSYYDLNNDNNILLCFEKVMLDGGSFGFETNTLGSHYLSENIGIGGKIDLKSKINAMLRLIFPKPEYVRKYYNYSVKHHCLTPIAYINRIFDAVFKRCSHSLKTANEIFSDKEISKIQAELIKVLNLNN